MRPSSYHKMFRFEAVWTREAECEAIIANGWNHINFSGSGIGERIQNCSRGIQVWAQRRFSSIPKRMNAKRIQLTNLRTQEHMQSELDLI